MDRVIVLDAGVVIGYLNAADAHHAAALNLLEQNPEGYLMHPLTIAEVLVGPARLSKEAEVWRDLQMIGVEVAELGSDEPLLLARLRAQRGLRMPDICVLAAADHHGVALATFDRQLANAARSAGYEVLGV